MKEAPTQSQIALALGILERAMNAKANSTDFFDPRGVEQALADMEQEFLGGPVVWPRHREETALGAIEDAFVGDLDTDFPIWGESREDDAKTVWAENNATLLQGATQAEIDEHWSAAFHEWLEENEGASESDFWDRWLEDITCAMVLGRGPKPEVA